MELNERIAMEELKQKCMELNRWVRNVYGEKARFNIWAKGDGNFSFWGCTDNTEDTFCEYNKVNDDCISVKIDGTFRYFSLEEDRERENLISAWRKQDALLTIIQCAETLDTSAYNETYNKIKAIKKELEELENKGMGVKA